MPGAESLQADHVTSASSHGLTLPLAAYADAVRIGQPFQRSVPLEDHKRPAAIRELIARLLDEDVPQRVRAFAKRATDAGRSPREVLRGLLTLRPPRKLPGEFHSLLGGVLEAELQERGVVDGGALLTLTPRGGPSGETAVALWHGDITRLQVGAIVNAANSELLGCFQPQHACIDNAIHAWAGPQLREDCAVIMAMQGSIEPTGCAKATRAYHLPARFVLHTVGPIANGAPTVEHDHQLANCYHSVLSLAAELPGVRSVAFCSISTGVFHYPKGPAEIGRAHV